MGIRKFAFATFFVVLLVIPSVFGAIPLQIETPLGTASLSSEVAEARARNTSQNRLRNLRVPTSGVNLAQNFAANRHSYTINVRENVGRVQLQPTRDNNRQTIRHRIDTRRADGSWNNGGWSRWRSGNAANNRIAVNINQQQERRVNISVRDRNGNVRTYTVNLRRASTNTFASALRFSHGTLNRGFDRGISNYTLNLPANRHAINIGMNRAQANAQMRVRVGNGAWSGFQRANITRTVSIPANGTQTVRFEIRGAWSNVAPSPTRVRTYTITINRAQAAATPAPTPPATATANTDTAC